MQKILLITSEALHPKEKVLSVFELSQARILKIEYGVSILSVRSDGSCVFLVKSAIKSLLSGKFSYAKNFLLKLSAAILKRRTNVHLIDGIRVYESRHVPFQSPTNYLNYLDEWLESGNKAFGLYVKREGMPNLIHAHGRFLSAGCLAYKLRVQFGIPYVYTEHSTLYQAGKAPLESKGILDRILSSSAAVIGVSSSLLRHVEMFVGRSIPNAKVIPNVLNPIFERPLNRRGGNPDGIRILTVAAMEHKKGLDILLEAFSLKFNRDHHYTLTLVGEGSCRHELIGLADRLGLSGQVIFKENCSNLEICEMMDSVDLFVLPSRIETFGVVVIEALSRGLPVVATRSGGPEYIITEECGILVKPEDIKGLADAMLSAVQRIDSFNREAIRKYAIDRFGSESFLHSIKNVYNSILN
ncbi:MAG TPA: glycosyltransferase [Cyclobacteriaceae bacterium]|nr:glycosyltransferase [Cyclobacteriaceae bacterium]